MAGMGCNLQSEACGVEPTKLYRERRFRIIFQIVDSPIGWSDRRRKGGETNANGPWTFLLPSRILDGVQKREVRFGGRKVPAVRLFWRAEGRASAYS